jgi:hypothetical protein
MISQAYVERILEFPDDVKPNQPLIMAGLRKRYKTKKHWKVLDILEDIVL